MINRLQRHGAENDETHGSGGDDSQPSPNSKQLRDPSSHIKDDMLLKAADKSQMGSKRARFNISYQDQDSFKQQFINAKHQLLFKNKKLSVDEKKQVGQSIGVADPIMEKKDEG